jgi:hypothetical protein
MRRFVCTVGVAALVFATTAASAANLAISIGVRETGAGGGPVTPIGGNGGVLGGIEFVNLDLQTLVLDGTFQTFTFDFSTAAYTAFAGTTANGVLDGSFGVLEHIRIRNVDGITDPIELYIDNIRQIDQAGAPTVVSNFEPFAPGLEVTFQEPRFSGSTSAFLALTPNTSLTSTNFASEGTVSDKIDFQFVNNVTTNWLRLTTNNAPNLPNPAIVFNQRIAFDIRGLVVPEPGTSLLFLSALPLLARRRQS